MGYNSPISLPSYFRPNVTGDITGVVDTQKANTIYDRPPAELAFAIGRGGNTVPISVLLRAMGYARPSDRQYVGHYEIAPNDDSIRFASLATPSAAAGGNAVLVVHADDMFSASLTANGTAIKTSPARVGAIIELGNRKQVRVLSIDSTVDPHRITVTPLAATDSILAADVQANKPYAVVNLAHGEATGLPTGLLRRHVKYRNDFVIIKEAFGSSGTELTKVTYAMGVNGEDTSYKYLKTDAIERFEKQKSRTILFGQSNNNLTQFNAALGIDQPIATAEGLIEFAETAGYSDTYTIGAFALSDLDKVAIALKAEGQLTDNNVIAFLSSAAMADIENAFVNILDSNADVFVKLIPEYGSQLNGYTESIGERAEDLGLNFGIRTVKKAGINFHFKVLDEFSTAFGFGSDAYDYQSRILFFPAGWVMNQMAQPIGAVGYAYAAKDGYSREVVVGDINGAGVGGDNTPYGQASHEIDYKKSFMLCEMSPHFALGNNIFTLIGA
jgi:archaellin